MKLIGMKAIREHFKGMISEDLIRRWIHEYDFPAIKSSKDRGILMADSDQVDEWYTRYTLQQTYPKKVVDRILSGPKQTKNK